MNSKLDKEKDLLQEFKALAAKIESANTFSGLLMYQSDIQRFYEDFIFIKKLNERKDAKEIAESFAAPPPSQKLEAKTSTDKKPEPKTVETPNMQTEAVKSDVADSKLDYNFSINANRKPVPIQLDFNDSLAFQNYLFEGEKDEFHNFIENLNNRNEVTSISYIAHIQQIRGWGKKENEYIQRLLELNNNRFE